MIGTERFAQIMLFAGWTFQRTQDNMFIFRRISDGAIRAFSRKTLDGYAMGMQYAAIDAEIDASPELQEMQDADFSN